MWGKRPGQPSSYLKLFLVSDKLWSNIVAKLSTTKSANTAVFLQLYSLPRFDQLEVIFKNHFILIRSVLFNDKSVVDQHGEG